MIAVETTNILSTNRVACGTGINFRHFSGEMLAFSHLKNTKKIMPVLQATNRAEVQHKLYLQSLL